MVDPPPFLRPSNLSLEQLRHLRPGLAPGLGHKHQDDNGANDGDRGEDEVAGGGLKESSNLE